MRIGGGDGDRRRAGFGVGAADGRRRGECAGGAGDAADGFALLAEGDLRGGDGTAGVVVEQDGLDDGGEIAADAVAVVVEFLHNTIEILAARITGDEPLDQLAADERPDILIVENRIERLFQILRAIRVEGGVG